MYSPPDIGRLSKLDLSGFRNGETVLYCRCGWQSEEHLAMPNACPECGEKLWYVVVDDELREIVRSEELKKAVPLGWYRIKATGQDAIPVAYAEDGTVRMTVKDLVIDYWYDVFGLRPDDLEVVEVADWWDGETIPPR